MSCFSKALLSSSDFTSALKAVKNERLPIGVVGPAHIHKVHFIHSLCEESSRRALVVAPDEAQASKLVDDLNSLGGGAYLYPARDFSFRSTESQSREYEHTRIGILSRMLEGDYKVVVCSAESAMQLTMPPEQLYRRSITIKLGQEIKLDDIISVLLSAGYVRTELVEGSGQFAIRGGILDFFPPDSQYPIRAEFWGDAVDSLGMFDTISQRRTETIEEAKISPATEILFDSDEQLIARIEEFLESIKGKGAVKAKESLNADLDRLRSGVRISSLDRYLNLAYPEPATIFDYAQDALLFVCESFSVKDHLNNSLKLFNEDIKWMFEEGCLCKGLDRFVLTLPELIEFYEISGAIYLDNFARGSFDTPVKELISFTPQQMPNWNGTLSILLEDLEPAMEKGYTCAIMAGTEKSAKALADDLQDENIDAVYFPYPPVEFPKNKVSVLCGGMSAGLDYPLLKFMLLSQGKISKGALKIQRKNRKPQEGISSLEELHKGDYIVHNIHGIGIFDGISKLEVSGLTKDYIKIKYAKEDVLYVPVTQLDLVSKYIGSHDETKGTKLNKLGGKEWEKARSKVRAAVKDLAQELIKLYSERMKTKGYAFSEDTDMQNDFEQRFEFEETDDQLRCIDEIKYDMQQPFPMDRLLCGDVGFGKTEVALRAAFKCIAEGKQCAILVPTTILAFQHYQTIIKRFDGFPVEVEMLSRFRTSQEQSKIIAGLRRGSIDLVVGTHRLISKDIQFKDLGLVIVDEEQRFGVAQKERLKEMFPNVDVLTLSATPIPRTLNMAMSGIRDMSMIEEAPLDRQPVQTYVLEHDMSVLAEAMTRELRRGGQVYYLHNRVESIDSAALKIREAMPPDTVIGIAHGQMSEDELSAIWRRLLEGEIDILVCTTIIETGVDVPNANTLIIENADYLGLAQLHQIRGRVGRSARRASAYFTFTRGKQLSEIATERLNAIREFTEFGSGFKIAMRDLEIRGAGNILGAQQHGHIESVGYDMYLKLLAEAVSEERGEKPDTMQKDCLVDLQINAHIPEKYIESIPHRLGIYRRIADIRSQEDADDVIDELIDRFGDPPASVHGLIEIALLRHRAAMQNIYEIGQKGHSLLLYSNDIDMKKVGYIGNKMRGRILVSAGDKPYVSVKMLSNQSPLDVLREALDMLESYNPDKKGVK